MGKTVSTGEGLTFEKVWQMFQETDKKMKETSDQISRMENESNDRWGRFIESLVEGDLGNMLASRNIVNCGVAANSVYPFEGKYYEFDLIASNKTEVVVVEVKTTLKVQDIKDFLLKLDHFREIVPQFGNYTVLGAVAYLRSHPSTNLFAYRSGLFVIRATGNSALILNDDKFEPRKF